MAILKYGFEAMNLLRGIIIVLIIGGYLCGCRL